MYYIIEHDIRPDGIVNTSETARSTFASALSFYYDRASKLVVSEAFTSAHIMLVDDSINVVKADHLQTAYVEPEAEQEQAS